jgi:hypothetical protein
VRALALLFNLLLIATVLWDAFETLVLPRTVSRSLRLTRLYLRATWSVWSFVATMFFAERAVSTILRQPGSEIYCSDSTVRMSPVD